MKTIAVISQKGGERGKPRSRLALLALPSRSTGSPSRLLTAIGNARFANGTNSARHLRPRIQALPCPSSKPSRADRHGLGSFQETCRRNGADLLLVDTSPNSTDETLNVAELADLLIVPCVPSFVDLRALKRTRDIVKLADKPALAVVNLAKHFGTEATATGQTLAQTHQFQVCPHFVRDLIAFKRAYAADQTVFEYEPGGDAAADIERVYVFACGQLNMTTRSHDDGRIAING